MIKYINVKSLVDAYPYIHLFPEDVYKNDMNIAAGAFQERAAHGFTGNDYTTNAIIKILESSILKKDNKQVSVSEFLETYGLDNITRELDIALREMAKEITGELQNINKKTKEDSDINELIAAMYDFVKSQKYINKTSLKEWAEQVRLLLQKINININKDDWQVLIGLQKNKGTPAIIDPDLETIRELQEVIKMIKKAEEKRYDKGGRLGKKSLKSTIRNVASKVIGEQFVALAAEVLNKKQKDIEKEINNKLIEVALKAKAPNAEISLDEKRFSRPSTTKTQGNKSVKSDVFSDNGLFTIASSRNGNTLSLQGNVNISAKEYREAQSKHFSIVSGTPITTFLNDYSIYPVIQYGAFNAIAHSSNFEEIYSDLKSSIAGSYFTQYLMGSGQKIKGSNSPDTALILVVGTNAYSMLDVIRDIRKGNSTVSIEFAGEKEVKKANVREEGASSNLKDAIERSNKVKEAINKITISAKLNANFYGI